MVSTYSASSMNPDLEAWRSGLTCFCEDSVDVGAIPDAECDGVLVKGVVGELGQLLGVAEVERNLRSCVAFIKSEEKSAIGTFFPPPAAPRRLIPALE